MLPKRMFLKRRLWFCVGFGAFVVLFQNFVLLMVSIVNNSEESSLFTLEGKKAKPVVHSNIWPEETLQLQSRITKLTRGRNPEIITERPSPSSAGARTCHARDDPLFPLCSLKVESFRQNWNPKCHGEKHAVNSSNLCSVIKYLSEVEAWCPVLPWRQDHNPFKGALTRNKALINQNASGLLEKLKAERYTWMRMRISQTWPQWMEAIKDLAITEEFFQRERKKILLYMAGIEYNFNIFEGALKGGVLGELTQWTDLMCALHILGHELIISSNTSDLSRYATGEGIITPPDADGCADKIHRDSLDLIFTDIQGVNNLGAVCGPHFSRYRCKFRVLDSFGTDAEFNYGSYQEKIPGGRSVWGNLDLLLPQFMTMYPHSPDNSFLGFAVPRKQKDNRTKEKKERKVALIYGKAPNFWQGKKQYIDTVKKYFHEVHANVGGKHETLSQHDVPDYVINHGIVNITTLMSLFHRSKVFIGLGEPIEGPAALEALANGCSFLNPKFIPPLDRLNHWFFQGKPMDRKATSQNPYAEVLVGKPFVHTVDIKNISEVEEALQAIANTTETPHLPFEFTVTGMLERLNAYVEYQDFCKPTNWPPVSELRVVIGQQGQSCIFACLDKGLVCEPTFFGRINTHDTLERAGFPCVLTVSRESILAPSTNTTDNTCVLQSQPMLFSCRAAKPGVVRVCPCRSYRKEQVALCESCLKKP